MKEEAQLRSATQGKQKRDRLDYPHGFLDSVGAGWDSAVFIF